LRLVRQSGRFLCVTCCHMPEKLPMTHAMRKTERIVVRIDAIDRTILRHAAAAQCSSVSALVRAAAVSAACEALAASAGTPGDGADARLARCLAEHGYVGLRRALAPTAADD